MKKSNLWQNVLTIVAVVVVLIIGGAVTNLSHQDEAQFLPDDKPENVAFNYQLAIIKRDFTRAYGYISRNLPGYPPDVDKFKADIEAADGADFSVPRCVYIDTMQAAAVQAEVSLVEQWHTTGPCPKVRPTTTGNARVNPMFMLLELESAKWKIRTSNGHFPVCWSTKEGCK